VTGAQALAELLDRLGTSRAGQIYVDEVELRSWPAKAVTAMKSAGLLAASADALSVICPGCERQCTMPVHVLPAVPAFVVCDKRSDINRVAIETESLKRWVTRGEAVAALLARLLRLRRRAGALGENGRWEIGTVRGRKGSSHLVLKADGELKLDLAGHTLVLTDVLRLKGAGLAVDQTSLIGCVDNPVSGGGDRESAEQRRARLIRRLAELKSNTRRDFFRTVAREEGISQQRLRQIVDRRKT
jgi:hypothetical protein